MTSFDEKPNKKWLLVIWLSGAAVPWALYGLVELVKYLTQ